MGAKVASISASASAPQSSPAAAAGVAYQLLHKHMPSRGHGQRAEGRGQRARIGSGRFESGRSQQVQLITLFSWINEGERARDGEKGESRKKKWEKKGESRKRRQRRQRGVVQVAAMFDRLNF